MTRKVTRTLERAAMLSWELRYSYRCPECAAHIRAKRKRGKA